MEQQLITTAHRCIENAESIKEKFPDKARALYLEAAENYLKASKLTQTHQKAYLDSATRYYAQAKMLEKRAAVQENTQQSQSALPMKKPSLRFSDIAGLEDVKEEIRLKIIEPFQHPEVFEYFGKKAGGGILMYGPPGCGKSMIAEATAGEANATFFNVRASDLKSKFVGETEKNIANLFDEARKNAPSIIFFDEFEALGASRSSTDPYTKSAVSELLSQMNGVGTKDAKILLIAATNVPWEVDVALRREGRFGTTIFIPPPDVYARHGLLERSFSKRPLSKEVKLLDVALKTKGFSGADLMALVERATDIPLKEYLKTKNRREILLIDLTEALHNTRPSIEEWFKHAKVHLVRIGEQDAYREVFEYEAKADMPLDALLAVN
jgi:transitional endoplasmic reticulum ATPase